MSSATAPQEIPPIGKMKDVIGATIVRLPSLLNSDDVVQIDVNIG